MKFGLEDRHWQTIEKIVVTPLKAKGAQVWVFGSRARGSYQQFSDLDILYKMESGSLANHSRALMAEALEQSNLPIKVDLVAEIEVAASYLPQILLDRIAV